MASQTVLALLDNAQHTERVVHALQQAGFPDKDISVMMRDWTEREEPGESPVAVEVRDTVAGAVVGAIPGLLATLVGSVFLPGLGWVRVAGPLMAALGAVHGAMWGAALGEIAASDIPEDQIRKYHERVEQGHVLLAVHTNRQEAPRAESLLAEHGAQEIYRTV